MRLLVEPLHLFWADRPTGAVYGNMALSFRRPGTTTAVRVGPDAFVVRDCLKFKREKWVVDEAGIGPMW